MTLHADNRKVLCYVSIAAAVGAVLCVRAGNWVIAGVCLAISGSALAAAWLSAKYTHTHLHLK